MKTMRIGIGYDVHAFEEGRDLVLGGVKIEYPLGLAGHSDADVLVHAIIDALCGAAGLGDIGTLFPDTHSEYKNIHSILLLEKVYSMLLEVKAEIINIDSVIVCEKPKIRSHTSSMKLAIGSALGGLPVNRIGIKGTTTEKLGFTGRSEGIAAQAVALLQLN